jgi:hypothetical protein
VDAPDDEHLARAGPVTELVGDDRATLERTAQDHLARIGTGGRRGCDQERERKKGENTHRCYVSSLPL